MSSTVSTSVADDMSVNDSFVYGGTEQTASLSGSMSYMYTVMGYILLVCGVLGLLENGLIIVLIRADASLRGGFHQLLEALSWTQLLMSLLGNPMSATSALAHGWRFGEAGCVFYGFVMTALGLMSINILTLISFERYICISAPHMAHVISARSVAAALTLCLAAALAWAIFPLAGWSQYTADRAGLGCCPTLSHARGAAAYTHALLVLQAVLPFGIMLYCYSAIIHTVRKSSRAIAAHIPAQARIQNTRRENKVALMIAIAVVAFALSWWPYCFASLLYAVEPDLVPDLAYPACAFIAKCSTIWNPLIYMAGHAQYQRAFVRLVYRWRGIQEPVSLSANTVNRTDVIGAVSEHDPQDAPHDPAATAGPSKLPAKNGTGRAYRTRPQGAGVLPQ